MNRNSLLFIAMLICTGSIAQPNEIRQGVWYEIFVRSFADSDGDGVGDINGITAKIPYLKELGITGIWLTPVHPSPTYHKYDVMDYRAIDPQYGTLTDFKNLITQAHSAGIRVVMDLVVNHTSSRHPWFIESSRNNPEFRNFYSWSDSASTEGWHINPMNPTERYYGFFWEGMPDLNFDNPAVRKEINVVGHYWLNMGVDGFRLDAAQHVYDAKDTAANNAWWTAFHHEMKKVNPQVLLIGEVWNKDSMVASYLKSSLNACFNFDLSKAILDAVSKENAGALVTKLINISDLYRSYNPNYIDATFISNHDQDRYRSTFANDPLKTRLAFSILMTLPGVPFLYYGEEAGMLGKFPDHYRREPMYWGDKGDTHWELPRFSKQDSIVPINVQMKDSSSYYYYYKQLIQLRKSMPILATGRISKSNLSNKISAGVLVYDLEEGARKATVIHNVTSQQVLIPRLPIHQSIGLNGARTGSLNFTLPPGASLILMR